MISITIGSGPSAVTTFLSEGFVDLSQRKIELDHAPTDNDPEIMAAAYEALAEEFMEWKNQILAGNCLRHAAEWKAKIGRIYELAQPASRRPE